MHIYTVNVFLNRVNRVKINQTLNFSGEHSRKCHETKSTLFDLAEHNLQQLDTDELFLPSGGP